MGGTPKPPWAGRPSHVYKRRMGPLLSHFKRHREICERREAETQAMSKGKALRFLRLGEGKISTRRREGRKEARRELKAEFLNTRVFENTFLEREYLDAFPLSV